MKIRMLNQISGTLNGVEWPEPGSVLDVPDDLGKRLVEQKNAIVWGEKKSRSAMKSKKKG